MATKPMKTAVLLKTLHREEASLFREVLMQDFRASAEVAAIRSVNLEPIGEASLPNMPRSLRVECDYLEGIDILRGDPIFALEFYDGNNYFGSIAARVRLSDKKIWLYDMNYKAKINGFAPYAMRHLIDAFRDIKQLVLATGVMADPEKCKIQKPKNGLTPQQIEHAKLKNFDRLGFRLVEEATQQRMGLPESYNHIRGCRAVFQFDDAETRASVFRYLDMPSDAELNAKETFAPGRSRFFPQLSIGHQACKLL